MNVRKLGDKYERRGCSGPILNLKTKLVRTTSSMIFF